MLRDDLIATVGFRLGSRKNMEARIRSELIYLQRSVLEQHEWLPWFLETELASTTTTADEARVLLPTNFLAETEESALYLRVGDGLGELEKGEFDLLMKKYPGSGCPQAYCLVGDYLTLFPKPDAEYGLEMRYYGRDVSMVEANVETKWLKYASDLVLALVCYEIAGKHLRDQAQAAVFLPDIGAAWARLYNVHVAKQEVNQSRTMGGGK